MPCLVSREQRRFETLLIAVLELLPIYASLLVRRDYARHRLTVIDLGTERVLRFVLLFFRFSWLTTSVSRS